MLNGIFASALPRTLRKRWRDGQIAGNIQLIHGIRSVKLFPNEAAATCVVRNGEYYVGDFIKHYLNLGIKHIFVLDNGSTDRTIAIAAKHSNVSIYRSSLPIGVYQAGLKRCLARNAVLGDGWCLDADVDEFFDYPHSNKMQFKEFLDYLNNNQYTAVLTQLLDMFSDEPLSALTHREQVVGLRGTYRFYDISQVRATSYIDSELSKTFGGQNNASAATMKLLWGGIRKTLYGNDCLLTKHSLFRSAAVEPFTHVHYVDGANLADVSAVMLHYKLTSTALATAIQNRDQFSSTSAAYARFVELLRKDPDLQVKRDSSVEFGSVRELVDKGFLFCSAKYDRLAMRVGGHSPRQSLDHS